MEPSAPEFKYRSKIDPAFELIHERIVPADVRDHEKVLARIRPRAEQPSEYLEVRVWAISPLGVELHIPTNAMQLNQGDSVDLELVVYGKRTSFQGLVCSVVLNTTEAIHAGIRFSSPPLATTTEHAEKRTSSRWLCSEEYVPVAHCPSPGKFDDVIRLKLRDVSADGMQLSTSLRNKYLIPGMTLALTIVFPLGPIVQVKATVARTIVQRIGAEDRLVVGVTFSEITDTAKKAFGQYLIQFSNAESIAELTSIGFSPESVGQSSSIYYLKTEEDYLAALQLRFQANQLAEQLGSISKPADTGDMFDTKARIMVAKRHGEVIGTGRFRFPLLDEPLELEQFITWPNDFPRRDQLVEVSRLATDPRFQHSDLLASMLKYAASTVLSDERPWVLATVMKKYIPFYQKIGFEATDLTFDNPKWDGTQHVVIMDGLRAILGKNVKPLYWNFLWSEVADFWVQTGMVEPTRLDRIRMLMLRQLKPLTRLAVSSKPRYKRTTK
ncbi:MAG: PilZ domain-containing protein [Pseudomonadota bacterium]